VALSTGFGAQAQALLTDPQTSGGLLVSCAPAALDEVMAVFARHGFGDAAVIGSMQARANGAALLQMR
jgi:selenide,water dikinase